MPKIMLHDAEAREALGRGVAKLTKAVGGTLGPRGMNAVMDRPIGTPLVSRDGVSIASEIELECPFENMGAQVVREVSKQTNEVAGDGTTTATVLANFLVQNGLALLAEGANPVELVEGLELAVDETIEALKRSAKSLDGVKGLRAIASIAANDTKLGEIVAEAFERAGTDPVGGYEGAADPGVAALRLLDRHLGTGVRFHGDLPLGQRGVRVQPAQPAQRREPPLLFAAAGHGEVRRVEGLVLVQPGDGGAGLDCPLKPCH